MSTEIRKIGRIAVGVDGSTGSRSALRWALDLAGMTGAGVTAVAAWTLGGHLDWTVRMTNYGLITLPETPSRDQVQAAVEESVADVVKALAGSPDQVARQVREGHATTVLIEAANDADLLVLGRRGHSGLASLLGSVSRHCVDHAPCPVVVVPPNPADQEDQDDQDNG
jgi:nucleotide-binding universal stress UspA family protein